ncbi:unnamed protein product [Mycena citricolor]|uniref:Magnesium transporter n=2 Tax=Mycena citricolor TaxID=2018698 RepID=A0AAD2H6Q4_9AGAR|nr:unnamed protein product [Mycena citricolor]
MPRENSDSDGRSLTPDMQDGFASSPTHDHPHPPRPSFHSQRQHKAHEDHPPPLDLRSTHIPPLDRFRQAARKVIALHRGVVDTVQQRGVGIEPGVDPRSPAADVEFEHLRERCVIEIADYSAVRSSFGRMTNAEFVELMNDPVASERERWVKVRWISIGGVSWDVIKAVAIRYNLNPMALEEIVRSTSTSTARSKVDYFSEHLFLRILCHELGNGNPLNELLNHPTDTTLVDGSVPAKGDGRPTLGERRVTGEHRRFNEAALNMLKSSERVDVHVLPMYIFLLRDGTVISLHSAPNLDLTQSITTRLRQFNSMLRMSADAPLLVQSILNIIVHKALEVVQAYEEKIQLAEHMILSRPTMESVRNMHVLSADLLLHRRTLAPIQAVVGTLRKYDVDRAAALVDTSQHPDEEIKVEGYMSQKALTYLADVSDHIDHVITQLEDIAGRGQNLVDYTFSMTSYDMNQVMRQLMIVSIVFMPFTFLCGYFGMNFEHFFPHERPDKYYWIISLPIATAVISLFLWPDIKGAIHYMRKRALVNNSLSDQRKLKTD